jgi:hypothetical protein
MPATRRTAGATLDRRVGARATPLERARRVDE